MKRVILFFLFFAVTTATSWGQHTISGEQTGSNTISAIVSPCYGSASTWKNLTTLNFVFYNDVGNQIGNLTLEVKVISSTNCTATLEFPSINFDEVFGGQAASMSFFCACNGSGTSGEINLIPAPLPITISNFFYKGNTLYWKTDSEINVSHFDIESSQDGITYEWENEVVALNSSTGGSYQQKFKKNNCYYQLKAVDFDGKFSLSEPLLVRSSENEPINQGYSWSYDEELFLFNSYGGLMKKSKNVSLENLPSGIYYIKWDNFQETIKVSWLGL